MYRFLIAVLCLFFLVASFIFWALLYSGSMYRDWESEDREQLQAILDYEENRHKKTEEKLRKQAEKKAKKHGKRDEATINESSERVTPQHW